MKKEELEKRVKELEQEVKNLYELNDAYIKDNEALARETIDYQTKLESAGYQLAEFVYLLTKALALKRKRKIRKLNAAIEKAYAEMRKHD